MCIGNENRLFRGREPVSPAEEFLHLSQPNLRAVRVHLQQQNIRITYTRPAQVRCDYERFFFIIIKFDSQNPHAQSIHNIIYTITARGLVRNIISPERIIYYNICTVITYSIESGLKPHLFMFGILSNQVKSCYRLNCFILESGENEDQKRGGKCNRVI